MQGEKIKTIIMDGNIVEYLLIKVYPNNWR
jgi:hypothetical protein